MNELVIMLQKKISKYEKALISIACFGDGDEVSGHFDEPGAAREARKALGKKKCEQQSKWKGGK